MYLKYCESLFIYFDSKHAAMCIRLEQAMIRVCISGPSIESLRTAAEELGPSLGLQIVSSESIHGMATSCPPSVVTAQRDHSVNCGYAVAVGLVSVVMLGDLVE